VKTATQTKELFREYLGSAYLAQMSFQSYLAMRDLRTLAGPV